jgi:CelD/BcsL family acetyltransferase involved in cellulose biosynthesis
MTLVQPATKMQHTNEPDDVRNEPEQFRASSVECVQSAARFAQLATPWQVLEADHAAAFTFFQTYDWCQHWWNTVGQQNEDAALKIMLLWHGDRLAAVWPLMTDILHLGTTTLLPLTSPHAEYSNLIFDPMLVDQQTLSQFVDYALANVEVDLVSLPKIPAQSALHLALDNKGTLAPVDEIASIFDLSQFEDFAQYQASISKSTRRNRNKRKNKLARMGDLSYQTFFADAPQFADLVAKALQMKRDWLVRTGRNDAKLTIAGLSDCIGALCGDTNSKSGAVAGALMLDEHPVAVEIGFLQRGHYYSYIGAFDWDMREHSVGKIQIEEALKWAIENGADKYDLLAEPAGYKDAWSNNQMALQTRVFPRSMRGYFIGVLWQLHLRPFVKTIFNKLPSDWRFNILKLARSLRGQSNNKAS